MLHEPGEARFTDAQAAQRHRRKHGDRDDPRDEGPVPPGHVHAECAADDRDRRDVERLNDEREHQHLIDGDQLSPVRQQVAQEVIVANGGKRHARQDHRKQHGRARAAGERDETQRDAPVIERRAERAQARHRAVARRALVEHAHRDIGGAGVRFALDAVDAIDIAADRRRQDVAKQIADAVRADDVRQWSGDIARFQQHQPLDYDERLDDEHQRQRRAEQRDVRAAHGIAEIAG